MTVYAVPCAYTANNEPLFLQFGTQTAAEAARYAVNLEQRYWQMRGQAEARGEYTCSPAVNRSGKPCDSTIPHQNGRYGRYESGYYGRNTQTYEYPYTSADGTQATRTEYNATMNQPPVYEPPQQYCSQVQRPVCGDPDIARSVVPDISRTQPLTVIKGSYDNANVSTAAHTAPVSRGPISDTEDRCSDRSRRNPGQLPRSTPQEQSVHNDSNDVRDTSRQNTKVRDAFNLTDVDTKGNNHTEIEKATRIRGSKRCSEGQSQNTDDRPKRSRLNWSPKLHASFLAAVQKLGIEHAVPTAIIKEMKAEGLSRENVASHLQKYRSMLKKEKEDAEKRELLETLKSFMGNDPNNPRKSLTDEDVLKVAAERKRLLHNSMPTRNHVPAQESGTPIRKEPEVTPSKE